MWSLYVVMACDLPEHMAKTVLAEQNQIVERLSPVRLDVVRQPDTLERIHARALSEGAVDYFQSPVDLKKLVKTVERAMAPPA